MSETAALDLAAIREWVARARSIVAGEKGRGEADWLEALDCESTELGGTVLDALTRLADELARCRAERDALRVAIEAWIDWSDSPQGEPDTNTLVEQSRAALGEVTP